MIKNNKVLWILNNKLFEEEYDTCEAMKFTLHDIYLLFNIDLRQI
jgi:hypothetical protein